ncbi:MAG: class I SAM-dependent methyltransferase [Flammeovirgaceae bacterium]
MKAKYDKIGIHYNQTRTADPYLLSRLYELLEPTASGTYIDIGCGTGNYTIPLAEKGHRFIGIDPSEEMLEKAKKRTGSIQWLQGVAEAIPLQDHTADGLIASLTIHHWTDLAKGIQELHRILKPAGKLVIFTATPQQMEGYWLNHYFPQMLADSINQMPNFELIEQCMHQVGFKHVVSEKYFIKHDLQDHFLYVGKHRPQLYLSPQIRNGISSFAALANAEEVKIGLARLEKDMASGKIEEVIASYKNEDGDYLFLVAKK